MEKKKIETIKKTQTKKGVQTVSYYYIANGLTKREYFAAIALQGLLANDSALITSKVIDAVKAADALIEELSKKKTNDRKY